MDGFKQHNTSEVLDLLADTCKRVKVYGLTEATNVFCRLPGSMQLAFDLFLVRMGDPLAMQAGTPESRFKERIRRMVYPEA